MIRETIGRLLNPRGRPVEALTYEKAKELVRSNVPEDRLAVALDPEARPELLFFLARDASPAVRAAVAGHSVTPRQADLILAVDESAEVRTLVAEKVTRQIRSMPADESAQLWQLTISILDALARDDLASVRQLVAETARDLERIPSAVALSLAKDQVPTVAVPALGYPGRFADEELAAVVESAHDSRIVGAVARRPSIGAQVSGAIIDRGEEESIAVLLGNKSASIAPASLDKVIEMAPKMKSLHAPLVSRAELTDAGATRLAGFVSDSLVEVLEGRTDLGSATTGAITKRFDERLATAQATTSAPIKGEVVVPAQNAVIRVAKLDAEKRLTEDAVVDAIGVDPDFVVAALALRGNLPPAVVQKILASHTAKGLTALAWKAGYTMRLSLQLQMRVGRLPPKGRLTAAGSAWPMTPEEMIWQIEFFGSLLAED